MSRDPSRWWYALLPFPILVGLRYVLGGLTHQLLPTAAPSFPGAFPILLLGLGASLVGALVVATAPLYTVGLILDVRTLRNDSSWMPHRSFVSLGVIPLMGIFIDWFALLAIPAAIGYLELRRRRTGHPMGPAQSADGDRGALAQTSGIQPPSSQWLYGVVIPPLLELTGAVVLWIVRTTGLLGQGSDPLTLLVPVSLVLIALGLVPLFAISLYLDAKAVRDASSDTMLGPRFWGLLGLGSLIGLLLFRVTVMPIVALAYLLRRHL